MRTALIVVAVLIGADLIVLAALLAFPRISARWAADRRSGLNAHQPEIGHGEGSTGEGG